MTGKNGKLIVRSEGSLELYYSARCAISKSGDALSVTFPDDFVTPPDVLAIGVNPKTFSVLFSVYDEKLERAENKFIYFDFGSDDGAVCVELDFKIVEIRLMREGSEYRPTDKGAELKFRGFMTKENRKTDLMTFFIEIIEE